MPGKVKVKIVAGRNLPVMDRSSDNTDAYVEIKLGNTTFKTDVCPLLFSPHKADDSELQDEPLQIRLMDHDTYSANDAIGKVYLDLNPLLLPVVPGPVKNVWSSDNSTTSSTSLSGGAVMSGWIPVYDTMHGIRGEVNVIVKVELFSDFNKFRQSSCGVQFFCSPVIPYGYHAQVIHGFVEELVVNDDPEYQWIDKIRTPRASNEARQTLFLKLSGELQRKIGLKALDLGGNAVIGYQQCFDLEGESGIVVRGIGTAVTLVRLQEVTLQPPPPPLASSITSEDGMDPGTVLNVTVPSLVDCGMLLVRQSLVSTSPHLCVTPPTPHDTIQIPTLPCLQEISPTKLGPNFPGVTSQMSLKNKRKRCPVVVIPHYLSSDSKSGILLDERRVSPEGDKGRHFSQPSTNLRHLIGYKKIGRSTQSLRSVVSDDLALKNLLLQEDMRGEGRRGSIISLGLKSIKLFPKTKLSKKFSVFRPKLQSDSSLYDETTSTVSCRSFTSDRPATFARSISQYEGSTKSKVKFWKQHIRSSSDSIAAALIRSLMDSTNTGLDSVAEVKESPGSSPTSPSRTGSVPTGDIAKLSFKKEVPLIRNQIPVSSDSKTRFIPPTLEIFPESYLRLPFSEDGPELQYVDGHLIPNKSPALSSTSDSSSSDDDTSEEFSLDISSKEKTRFRPSPPVNSITNDVINKNVGNTDLPQRDKTTFSKNNLNEGFLSLEVNLRSKSAGSLCNSVDKELPRPPHSSGDLLLLQPHNIEHVPCLPPTSRQQAPVGEEGPTEKLSGSPATATVQVTGAGAKISPSPAKISHVPSSIHRRSSDSDLSITPKGNSLTGSDRSSTAGTHFRHTPASVRPPMNQESLDMLEYPFLTFIKFPASFIQHLVFSLHPGGTVSSRSVKLLERITNLEEPETRDAWWTEIRMEVRSHARALGCNVVLGYSEHTSICDDVCVLSASGTAAVINLDADGVTGSGQHHTRATTQHLHSRGELMTTSLDRTEFSDTNGKNTPQKNDHSTATVVNATKSKSSPRESVEAEVSTCSLCHIPYNEASVPFRVTMLKCAICRRGKVPDVLFTTIELPEGIPTTGTGCLLQAYVCRPKPYCKGEMNAKEISDGLPFLEYELHRLLINKLKVKGMNTIFGLRVQVQIGEKMLVGLATGTAVFLTPLPPPPVPKVSAGNSWTDEKKLAEIQKQLLDTVKKNRETYQLKPISEVDLQTNGRFAPSDTEESDDELPDLDLAAGNKDTCVLEIDDAEDVDVVSLLMDPAPPEGFHVVNVETVPGLNEMEIVRNLQMFTQMWRAKIPVGQQASNLSEHFHRLLQAVYFKLRRMVPCALCDLQFSVELPEPDEMQLSVLDDSDMIFNLDDDHNVTETVLSVAPLQSQLGRVRPRSPQRVRIQPIKHQHTPPRERYGVDITPLSYVPGGKIEKYLGNLNFFFIRESTGIRECGGLSGFVHSFVTEVLAIVRAHVTALGGNAMVAYFISECILYHNPHKNQLCGGKKSGAVHSSVRVKKWCCAQLCGGKKVVLCAALWG
uniref:C2 domain-containing protein n=1 Tax=Timema tahoe TaxID=61484 RepID=A0A7R9NX08_9NEOP|nr:unnamed protein product [Timema tahoe]